MDDNDAYTVYFRAYDKATESYAVGYEVRQGACVRERGTHSTGYRFPYLAQAKADELNVAHPRP
jgi:acetate kinase